MKRCNQKEVHLSINIIKFNYCAKKNFDVDIIFVKLIKSIPIWFKFLLTLRNVIISISGLKTGKLKMCMKI